jgi:hypothetical protein
MNEQTSNALFIVVVAWVAVALPAVMVWGWVRWAKSASARTLFSRLSMIGFVLANISVLLALSSLFFAHTMGSSPIQNSLLLKLSSAGLMLAALGVALAFCAVWRASALRWPCVFCATGILAFWLFSAI